MDINALVDLMSNLIYPLQGIAAVYGLFSRDSGVPANQSEAIPLRGGRDRIHEPDRRELGNAPI